MMRCGQSRPSGIELLLDRAKGFVDLRAELPGDPFAAAQAVAVLAAVGALVFAHQRPASSAMARILGAPSRAHVEDRPHVQRADRGMRIPGAARAVARNTSVSASVYSARCSSGTAQSSMKLTGLPSPFRLIMMLRPALRTSHRFFCGASSGISHHRAGQAEVAHQLDQVASACAAARPCRRRRTRPAGSRRARRSAPVRSSARKAGLAQRQLDHGAVDQLDRGRAPSLTMCCAAVHRRVEGREVDDAQHLAPRQRRSLQRERSA